jgi:hypothetical protein
MTNTESIIKGLKFLEGLENSNDISTIAKALNRLAILTVRLGEEVTDAYQLQSEFEDIYDTKFAKRFSELTANGTSAAAAKPIVESELADLKKDWTAAKVAYKKLSGFLDRVDRVLDTFRQSVSVIKAADMKHLN